MASEEAVAAVRAPQHEIVGELASTLQRASELLESLQELVPSDQPAPADLADGEIEELRRRLTLAQEDLTEISSQLVETENQRGRLMNLYVATYQLHATLDQGEVISTIAEISRELLGARRFALLLLEDQGEECEVAIAEGFKEGEEGLYSDGVYRGGDAQVDDTLQDGVLRIGPHEESEALAIVPLRVQGTVVGAVVILELLSHKAALTSEDRDLLDLLAAHAASAIFAARVYSRTDRKLKTLESLVKLVR